MANGILRDIYELTLPQFQQRYGGTWSEGHLSDLRAMGNLREDILYIGIAELPNSDAVLYNDNTKIVTSFSLYCYDERGGSSVGAVAGLQIGSGQVVKLPAGEKIEVSGISKQLGFIGKDASTTGTPKVLLMVFGYTPATTPGT